MMTEQIIAQDTERKLARVVIIDDVLEHPNADQLELAIVGGWQCCVKKGDFSGSDPAVYCEVDSMLPLDNPAFAFLESKHNYTRDGVRYARIKTIKLRKELSQGILFPISLLHGTGVGEIRNDMDVTKALGIIKYEPAEDESSEKESPRVGGNVFSRLLAKHRKHTAGFPSFIPKTDQERIQNMAQRWVQCADSGEEFEVTYKLDGSSMTAYYKDGVVGVCSRNRGLPLHREEWGFKRQLLEWCDAFVRYNERRKWWAMPRFPKWLKGCDPESNHFTTIFYGQRMPERLAAAANMFGFNIAVQGELVAPSIQQNFEGVERPEYFVYNVFNIDKQEYVLPEEAQAIVFAMGLEYVPVFHWRFSAKGHSVQDLLGMADGPSGLNGKYREGLVFKSLIRDFSFKVISNNYLLKEA